MTKVTREETRRERYNKKLQIAKFFPISVVTIEFQSDNNLGQVIRSAACFGIRDVHVIGSIPDYQTLKRLSGSTHYCVNLIQHKNPYEFLDYKRKESLQSKIVSVELTEDAIELKEYKRTGEHIFVVVGNETTGVPVDIIKNSDEVLYIKMHGTGFCLNTAMAAHISLYELTKS